MPKWMKHCFACLVGSWVVLSACSAEARQTRERGSSAGLSNPTPAATFGASLTTYTVSAFDFDVGEPSFTELRYFDRFPEGRYFSTPGRAFAGVHLPNGAAIQGIELQGCSFDGVGLEALLGSWVLNPPFTTFETHGSVKMGLNQEGCRVWFSPIANVVVDSTRVYEVRVRPDPLGAPVSERFHAVRIYYRLRVSPPPAAATFADVPIGSPFHQFVEALFASGITGGCGGGNYCPNAPITRGQMAVFLAVALGLHWPN